jgi:hypothetical protein
MYRTRTYNGHNADAVLRRGEEVSSRHLRSILRYYHQVGILLSKGLIDDDFIFPLIGDGLESSAVGIRLAVEWYQVFYGGESGSEEAAPRRIYENAPKLLEWYESWKKRSAEAVNYRPARVSPRN